jgi:hypothetical protein
MAVPLGYEEQEAVVSAGGNSSSGPMGLPRGWSIGSRLGMPGERPLAGTGGRQFSPPAAGPGSAGSSCDSRCACRRASRAAKIVSASSRDHANRRVQSTRDRSATSTRGQVEATIASTVVVRSRARVPALEIIVPGRQGLRAKRDNRRFVDMAFCSQDVLRRHPLDSRTLCHKRACGCRGSRVGLS